MDPSLLQKLKDGPKRLTKEEYVEEHEKNLREVNSKGGQAERVEVPDMLVPSPASIDSLAGLESIAISEMQLNKVHNGKVLYCRTIVDPLPVSALASVVEDFRGDGMRLFIYNVPLEGDVRPFLARGRMLAIPEPFYKFTMDGGVSVRIDDPSKVVIFQRDQEDEFSRRFKAELRPEEFKERGNALFGKSRFKEACQVYTEGMACNTGEALAMLYLNRAACYSKLGDPDHALDDSVMAEKILSTLGDPTSPACIKACYRKASALIDLGCWEDASLLVSHLLSFPKDKGYSDFVALDKAIKRGLQEKSGAFDLSELTEEAEKTARLAKHAEYTLSSLKRAGTGGKGIVASSPISDGTLLVASKALAFVHDNFKSPTDHTPLWLPKEAKVALVNELATTANVPSKQPIIRSLHPSISQTEPNVPVDQEFLSTVVARNALCSDYCPILAPKRPPTFKGVWGFPSYFNHSCAPNCSWTVIGDFLFITALRRIAPEEELFINYFMYIDTNATLMDGLATAGIECSCKRCVTVKENQACVKYEADCFEEISDYLAENNLMESPAELKQGLIEIVDKFKQKLSPLGPYRISLIKPMQAIAHAEHKLKNYREAAKIHMDAYQLGLRSLGEGALHTIECSLHCVITMLEYYSLDPSTPVKLLKQSNDLYDLWHGPGRFQRLWKQAQETSPPPLPQEQEENASRYFAPQ